MKKKDITGEAEGAYADQNEFEFCTLKLWVVQMLLHARKDD